MPNLEEYLEQHRATIDSVIASLVVEEQKRQIIEGARGWLVINEAVNDIDKLTAIGNGLTPAELKDSLCALLQKKQEQLTAQILKIDSKVDKNLADRQDMMELDDKIQSLELIKQQIQDIELVSIESMVDKVAKLDQEHWLMINNGRPYLYKTSSIGTGDNGSVHLMLDIETGARRVEKLQYGRMDITEFIKNGQRFKDPEEDIEGDVAIANGQRYVITSDNTPYILVAKPGDDKERVSFSDPIFLKQIDERFFNFEFIAQTGSVVDKENQKSKNYKPGDIPFGIDKGQIDSASREFLEHVIPMPAEDVKDYQIKLFARQLLLEKSVDTPVFVLIQNYVEGIALDKLIDPKNKLLVIINGTPELKASKAIDFALNLIKSTKSLHTIAQGGDYDSRDPEVMGVYHRDIRPGNIKVTEDGQIKYLDLAAAVEYKKDKIAKAKMGKTEGYTDPAILAAIDANLGREVECEFTEKNEAYSYMRVIEDYLRSFIDQNPDAAEILKPVLAKFLAKFKDEVEAEYSFADMQNFMQQSRQQIKPEQQQGSAVAKILPKKDRPALVEGGPAVSARIAALMLEMQKQFSSSLPSDVPAMDTKKVKELASKFEGSKTTAKSEAPKAKPLSGTSTGHRRTRSDPDI